MPKTYEEIKQKSLERYHQNRYQINEKQKKYFREVYYVKHRDRLREYQRQYKVHGKIIDNVIIERNHTVYFN